MSEQPAGPEKLGWLSSGIAKAGAVAGALALIPLLYAGWTVASSWWTSRGTVELAGSFPGEVWRPATPSQFAWLADDWCYPSLPGFHSRFRVANGTLERQNTGTRPQRFTTPWINSVVHISNRGVIRVKYDHPEWSVTFVQATPGKTAEWEENERSTKDDGTVVAGRHRLVLSCARCQVSRDGSTYSCR
jgi:hypothetical protein